MPCPGPASPCRAGEPPVPSWDLLLDLNLSLPSRVLIPALPESWRRIPHVWPQNQAWTSGKSEPWFPPGRAFLGSHTARVFFSMGIGKHGLGGILVFSMAVEMCETLKSGRMLGAGEGTPVPVQLLNWSSFCLLFLEEQDRTIQGSFPAPAEAPAPGEWGSSTAKAVAGHRTPQR